MRRGDGAPAVVAFLVEGGAKNAQTISRRPAAMLADHIRNGQSPGWAGPSRSGLQAAAIAEGRPIDWQVCPPGVSVVAIGPNGAEGVSRCRVPSMPEFSTSGRNATQ